MQHSSAPLADSSSRPRSRSFPDMTSIVFSLSAVMLAYSFYQSRLIPRWLSLWGFVGAVLYLAVPLQSVPRGACRRAHYSSVQPGSHAPPWIETVRLHFPRYGFARRRVVRNGTGAGDLGRADVDG
jgi:Domain of unknown function (DUF4386)